MSIYIYDCEVFAQDWLVVFKEVGSGEYAVIPNDAEKLLNFMGELDDIYVGFNSKNYDQFIIKAICTGLNREEIKAVNDFIIHGGNGWECPLLAESRFRFNNVDLMDDMQKGLSLKAIEGHLGMDIEETEVDFNLDRPLTDEEMALTIKYCKHDVDAAEEVFKLRTGYIKNKLAVGRLAGIDDVKAMSMTNAKLTAAMLKAQPTPHDDERDYQYPSNLLRQYIPDEVFQYFDRMKDPNLSDEQVFGHKLDIEVGGCPVRIGFGGIHGAKKNYFFEADTSTERHRVIENDDVGSYYPHLMTINGYTSRNIPSPKIFADVLESRMAAKKAGDKVKTNALKLVLNTTYGASLNQYNALYDPLMGRSVCVSGQLYLLELTEHLLAEIEDLQVIQLNTDGIMVEFWNDQQERVTAIMREWQDRTGFTLEADKIARIYQKDVNNYIEVQINGKAKAKGGYLVKGIAPAGAFNINNNAVIVATAIKEYFLNGTPVEDTINACDDIFQFQMIAKAGTKYREAYHLVDGEKQPIQRVNRVYATTDQKYGKLFKVKAEDDSEAKIDSLPEHCIVDNSNHMTIDQVDRQFYIDMARKRINDFKGIKPEKKGRSRKMAASTTKETTPNIYERLAIVREKFAEAGIQKTGKNMQLKSMYFELDDIVPIARPLFAEQHLFPHTSFTAEEGAITIVDTLNVGNTITFTAPIREWTGNAAVTPVQAWGATQTYMRRYLYALALDMVEEDTMENRPITTAPAPVKAAPATPAQREEAKQELTNAAGAATELQVKQIKNIMSKILEKDPSKKEALTQIAVQTKGFTEVTKEQCEAILTKLSGVLNGLG